MQVRWRADESAAIAAADGRPEAAHRLRWETLGRNRDGQQEPPFPDPTMLEVVTYEPLPTGAAGRGG
jgi:hypothetical protein